MQFFVRIPDRWVREDIDTVAALLVIGVCALFGYAAFLLIRPYLGWVAVAALVLGSAIALRGLFKLRARRRREAKDQAEWTKAGGPEFEKIYFDREVMPSMVHNLDPDLQVKVELAARRSAALEIEEDRYRTFKVYMDARRKREVAEYMQELRTKSGVF